MHRRTVRGLVESDAPLRVGRVSIYLHHDNRWLYYRDGGQQVRRQIAAARHEAEQVAAQVNAQLAAGTSTLLAFTPIGVPELRHPFLDYHEHVLKSSVGTIRRYRTATRHLEDFTRKQAGPPLVHELKPEAFAAYLRGIEVEANGHPHAARRRLRDKGIQFILETSRAMYNFAQKRRHLPPYAGNPLAELPLDRLKIEDAKPIFAFDAATELAFLRAAIRWAFPIHFTLSKTGLRVGELVHLLIEEVDLEGGWPHVRNKTALGWRVKTGTERAVRLLPEVVAILAHAIGSRKAGPVFLRERFGGGMQQPLVGDRHELERACEERQRAVGHPLSRIEGLKIAQAVWREAGVIKPDAVRLSFIRTMRVVGHQEATGPKSWRHTFATLLQDANVDPLIRPPTLGHKPTAGGGLGMTANSTHTRREPQRRQIEQALRSRPDSLRLAFDFVKEGSATPRSSSP